MPTRSSGCLTCRKRKIRCDETRPVCKRCITHGVACGGYRTEQRGGLEFKDQTQWTVQRAKTKYLSSSNPSSEEDTSLSTPSSASQSVTTALSTRQHSPVSDGWVRAVVGGVAPQAFRSPSADRIKLLDTFVDLYLPKNSATPAVDHGTYIRSLGHLSSTQPALQQSLDCLTMVQVGSVHKDCRLLSAATTSYAYAVRSLSKALSKAALLHDDEILAAVTLLVMCELFHEIAQYGQGWGKHVQGAQQLLAARGPRSLNSPMAFAIFHSARHSAICHAIVVRRAHLFARDDWLQASRGGLGVDFATQFLDLALKIPGLLERRDRLDKINASSAKAIHEVLADCSALEMLLRDWLELWHTSLGRPPFEVVAIEDFERFSSLCPSRTFRTAFRYIDFSAAYLQSLYWVCMHELRQTILDLCNMRHKLGHDFAPIPSSDDAVQRHPASTMAPEEMETELLTYVLGCCQSVPYFVEPESQSTGSIGIFMPLRCGVIHSRTRRMTDVLKWCESVKDTVFTYGLFPPETPEAATYQQVDGGL